ncbi:uncharacterized protein C15orf41 homolog [Acanthaster planci]|uniref:CDAN1-interacting nuclease 1 n=1 Tax=Acanthaster planci TaxID=133434 RepID=A0A8B7ZDZ0_ACAPL|nr:uncharacterized protein C15orf41 homolog [Acanthaster planci]
MKLVEYKKIVECLETACCDGTKESLVLVQQQFPSLSYHTLISIHSQRVQVKTKKQHGRHSSVAAMEAYYVRYQKQVADRSCRQGTVLLGLAREIDLSPALLARIILERHLFHSSGDGVAVPKTRVTKMLREPYLIEDPVLSMEVQQCVLWDSSYGPLVDSIKHSIGVELEVHLKKTLKEHGLAFLGEEEMRRKGYDKTPDVKLQVPIAIGGRVVNWIESKASFGDKHSHENYMRDQFWSYVNRFGSGLVIYWFGFIEEFATSSEQGIILADDFPRNFTKIDSWDGVD